MPWGEESGFPISFYYAPRRALEPAAGQHRDTTFDFEPRKLGREFISAEAGVLGHLVDRDGGESHRVKHRIPFLAFMGRFFARRLPPEAELLEHIVGAFDELRALLDEPMATLRQRRLDPSCHRKNIAPLPPPALHARPTAP